MTYDKHLVYSHYGIRSRRVVRCTHDGWSCPHDTFKAHADPNALFIAHETSVAVYETRAAAERALALLVLSNPEGSHAP